MSSTPARLSTAPAAGRRDKSRPWVETAPALTQGMSLRQRAHAEIKHRIITLAFRPGEFINESTICKLLEMGRTPVHEALHMLKLEGLVEIIPRKGVLIRPDSLNDVVSLLEARMIIEPQCMGLAATRANAQHIEVLGATLEETRRAISEGNRGLFMLLDSRFHGELVRAAANSALADVMRLLHERASRIWYLQVWSDEDLKLTLVEHENIFNAVKRGDRDSAISTAQTHLMSLRRRILDRIS